MARRLTQDEVIKNIHDKVGDEYTLVSEYKNANAPIKMRHNKCCNPNGFHIWDTTYHNFMDSNRRCPCESHQVKITTEDFNKRLKEIHPNLTCVGEYINSGTKVNIHCSVCGFTFPRSPDTFWSKDSPGCPVCNKSKINYAIQGYNDLWTTNKKVAALLKDKNWGCTHTYYTREKTDFICPHCGGILHKMPSLVFNQTNGKVTCSHCSDGISYPEKFFSSVLNQLNITNFISQLTSSCYEWVGKYRYDFYLKDINCIVETHGGQHSEPEQMEIDLKKKELALSNGIDLYIEIDCSKSDMQWIKNSILNSKLAELYDLSNIDWKICHKFALKSIVADVCNYYKENNSTIPQIAKVFRLSDVTILRYLNKGNEIGLCDFDAEKNKSYAHSEAWKNSPELQKHIRPVYCHELNVVVDSVLEAKQKYKAYNLHEVCGNPNRTTGGYHWDYVDELSEDILKKITY